MSEAPEPSITRLQLATAALGLGLVLALGLVVAQSELTEWRAVQHRYNALAAAAGKPAIAVRLRQTWKPELDVVDRCTSCHLAMAGAEPLAGERLFAEHSPLPHDPAELGCTICHGGDGRATTARAAHGEVGAGVEPLIAAPHRDVGCGACHTGLLTPSTLLASRGEQLFREYDCQACHGASRPLTDVGLRGLQADWHERHLGRVTDGQAFAPLPDEDVPAVTEYLRGFVGAPRLMAGKRLVAERGCRGCHRIAGVGGEDGPDLSQIGLHVPEQLPPGPRGAALVAWHQAHLLDPAATVKDSRMPKFGLDQAQAELLAAYLVSLRPRALPETWIPRDRLRTGRLAERDFATDGASLFAGFCSACHGVKGEGRETADALGPVPSLTNTDALALADDVFLTRTISEGRPGRRMQAWANHEGALRADEVKALVGYLRSFEPRVVPFKVVMAAPLELVQGQRTFASSCAPCHGESGGGTVLAPPLAAADNVVTSDDNRLYGTLATGIAGTAMGAFRRFDAATLRGAIGAVRALPRLNLSRKEWKASSGDAGRGRTLFGEHCAKCHGKSGEGEKGPSLVNPSFIAAASDGFLTGTIIRGRAATRMPAFGVKGLENAKLTPEEVSDLVAFLRSKPALLAQQRRE